MSLDKTLQLGINDGSRVGKNTWITDCVVISKQNRIFTFTGDREILIYDSISLELYCRIGGFTSVPLRVSSYSDDTKLILLMGDEKGIVSLLVMKRLGDTLRQWKNSRGGEGVPSITIHEAARHHNVWFFKWKAHRDWITEVLYVKELNAIISSANHTGTAICISPMPDVGDDFSPKSATRFQDDNYRPVLNYISINKGCYPRFYDSYNL